LWSYRVWHCIFWMSSSYFYGTCCLNVRNTQNKVSRLFRNISNHRETLKVASLGQQRNHNSSHVVVIFKHSTQYCINYSAQEQVTKGHHLEPAESIQKFLLHILKIQFIFISICAQVELRALHASEFLKKKIAYFSHPSHSFYMCHRVHLPSLYTSNGIHK
jgi:hypothetical protein